MSLFVTGLPPHEVLGFRVFSSVFGDYVRLGLSGSACVNVKPYIGGFPKMGVPFWGSL